MKFVRFGERVMLLHNTTYIEHIDADEEGLRLAEANGWKTHDWYKERLRFHLVSGGSEGPDYVEFPLDQIGPALFWAQIKHLPEGVVAELQKADEMEFHVDEEIEDGEAEVDSAGT